MLYSRSYNLCRANFRSSTNSICHKWRSDVPSWTNMPSHLYCICTQKFGSGW